jgi:hypothetical protein
MLFIGVAFMLHTYDPVYKGMGIGAGVSPIFYPRIILCAWIALCLCILLEAFFKKPKDEKECSWKSVFLMLALIALCIGFMNVIGFLLSSIAFFFASCFTFGYRRLPVLLCTGLLFPVALWFIFVHVLQIPLPTSMWFYWV